MLKIVLLAMYDIKSKQKAVSLVYPEFITKKVVQLSLIVSVVGYSIIVFYNYSVYSLVV
jgi:hypothetical protein